MSLGAVLLYTSCYACRMLCKEGTLDPEKVKGKILVCLRGGSGRVSKGVQAHLAGAAGMILCNDNASGNGIIADPHLLPASNINYTDGLALYAYLNSTKYISSSLFSFNVIYTSDIFPCALAKMPTSIYAEIPRDILNLLIHNWTQSLLQSWLLSLLTVQT